MTFRRMSTEVSVLLKHYFLWYGSFPLSELWSVGVLLSE